MYRASDSTHFQLLFPHPSDWRILLDRQRNQLQPLVKQAFKKIEPNPHHDCHRLGGFYFTSIPQRESTIQDLDIVRVSLQYSTLSPSLCPSLNWNIFVFAMLLSLRKILFFGNNALRILVRRSKFEGWDIKLTAWTYSYQLQNMNHDPPTWIQVYLTMNWPSVRDGIACFWPYWYPRCGDELGFTDGPSSSWLWLFIKMQMLAVLPCRLSETHVRSFLIWFGSRPCDISKLNSGSVVIWPTFVFSFNFVLFQRCWNPGDWNYLCQRRTWNGFIFIWHRIVNIPAFDFVSLSKCCSVRVSCTFFISFGRLDWGSLSRGR